MRNNVCTLSVNNAMLNGLESWNRTCAATSVVEFSSRWSLHQWCVDRMLHDAVCLSITSAHPSPVRPSVLLLFSSVRPPTYTPRRRSHAQLTTATNCDVLAYHSLAVFIFTAKLYLTERCRTPSLVDGLLIDRHTPAEAQSYSICHCLY